MCEENAHNNLSVVQVFALNGFTNFGVIKKTEQDLESNRRSH
jgi:hypothetical protein